MPRNARSEALSKKFRVNHEVIIGSQCRRGLSEKNGFYWKWMVFIYYMMMEYYLFDGNGWNGLNLKHLKN